MADQDVNKVITNFKEWVARRVAAAQAVGEAWAGKMEQAAKDQALWDDRTGHARQGLFGRCFIQGDDLVIILAHSVDYGIFLELANDGKYAVVDPLVKHYSPQIFAEMKALFAGMGTKI